MKYEYDGRFGLICGQTRGRRGMLIKNAGWYDQTGRKLGWGDLSLKDANRIAASLRKGELFIVLGERDSWWHFVRFVERGKKTHMRVSSREKAPGKRYLADRAQYIIAPRKRHLVDRGGFTKRRTRKWGVVVFHILVGAAVGSLIDCADPSV